MTWITGFAAAGLSLAMLSPAYAAGDVKKGQALVKLRCGGCHSVTPDTVRHPGPTLHGIAGRKAASVPGFSYSNALKTSKIAWSATELDQYLAAPGKKAPGTLMVIAVPNVADRADIVAFLSTLKR